MRLNRRLNRRLGSLLTRRTNGRRFRRRNLLAEACRALNLCIRQSKKMARADPHLLGPHARAYYRDVLRQDEQAQLIKAALEKVYGPTPAGVGPLRSVWHESYDIPPEQRRIFFKWFKEHYGP
jgi:hypothetical protein